MPRRDRKTGRFLAKKSRLWAFLFGILIGAAGMFIYHMYEGYNFTIILKSF